MDFNIKSKIFHYCEIFDMIISPAKSKSCMDICIKNFLPGI